MSQASRMMVGTTKGAFLLDRTENGWAVSGPHCDGWPINHFAHDPESGRIWAGGGGDWPGAGVWRSDDSGASWQVTKLASGKWDQWLRDDPEFAERIGQEPEDGPFDGAIDSVWSLMFANGALWAGTRPAVLLKSTDGGESFARVEALSDHPTRKSWQPGAAGLSLHTILAAPDDPAKLWVGISAAGVWASEDGGESWERRNRVANEPGAVHLHEDGSIHPGEVGGCVHNMMLAPGGRLYQQNHHGVFTSTDGGRSWHEITAGLPSDFGFPVGAHPTDPNTAWVIPLNGDSSGRFPPGASAAVWKTTDAGAHWAKKQAGLPTENCYFTVLRQAMAVDAGAGVYFGTNTGSIFASSDEGESWDEIARHLPTVLCVEVM